VALVRLGQRPKKNWWGRTVGNRRGGKKNLGKPPRHKKGRNMKQVPFVHRRGRDVGRKQRNSEVAEYQILKPIGITVEKTDNGRSGRNGTRLKEIA